MEAAARGENLLGRRQVPRALPRNCPFLLYDDINPPLVVVLVSPALMLGPRHSWPCALVSDIDKACFFSSVSSPSIRLPGARKECMGEWRHRGPPDEAAFLAAVPSPRSIRGHNNTPACAACILDDHGKSGAWPNTRDRRVPALLTKEHGVFRAGLHRRAALQANVYMYRRPARAAVGGVAVQVQRSVRLQRSCRKLGPLSTSRAPEPPALARRKITIVLGPSCGPSRRPRATSKKVE